MLFDLHRFLLIFNYIFFPTYKFQMDALTFYNFHQNPTILIVFIAIIFQILSLTQNREHCLTRSHIECESCQIAYDLAKDPRSHRTSSCKTTDCCYHWQQSIKQVAQRCTEIRDILSKSKFCPPKKFVYLSVVIRCVGWKLYLR